MNRLLNQRVYLAGAMDRVSDRGKGWRNFITPFLRSLGVKVLNPLDKPISIAIEDDNTHQLKLELKKNEEYDELSSLMRSIRAVDLRMVDISDFLIVNLDLETHPCGTLEEIFWANRQKKPVIINMVQGKKYTPDWLFGTVPHQMIFSSWDEVKTYLDYINSSSSITNHKRWYFFNI